MLPTTWALPRYFRNHHYYCSSVAVVVAVPIAKLPKRLGLGTFGRCVATYQQLLVAERPSKMVVANDSIRLRGSRRNHWKVDVWFPNTAPSRNHSPMDLSTIGLFFSFCCHGCYCCCYYSLHSRMDGWWNMKRDDPVAVELRSEIHTPVLVEPK